MAIDYRNKSSEPYDPTAIVKRDADKTALSNTPQGGVISESLRNFPPFQRLMKRQQTKTIQTETNLVNAQTGLIDANTNQEKSLQKNAKTKIKGGRYSPINRQKDIQSQDKLADIKRQRKLEKQEHKLAMDRRKWEEELVPPPEGMTAKERALKKETDKKQRVAAKREKLQNSIDESLQNGLGGDNTQYATQQINKIYEEHGGEHNVPEHIKKNIADTLLHAERMDRGLE